MDSVVEVGHISSIGCIHWGSRESRRNCVRSHGLRGRHWAGVKAEVLHLVGGRWGVHGVSLKRVLLTLNLDGFSDGLHVPLQLVLKLSERHTQHRLQVTHKAIHVSLPGNFVDDVLVIVVAKASAQLLVIHFWLVFPSPPAPGNLLRVNQLELPFTPGPRNTILAVAVCQKLQQKLPELDGPRARRVGRSDWRGGARARGGIGAVHWRMERGTARRRNGRTSRGRIRSGTVGEGGAPGTVVWVGWRLQEAAVGHAGQGVGSKVVNGVVDCDGWRGASLRRASQGFVADHGVEGDV